MARVKLGLLAAATALLLAGVRAGDAAADDADLLRVLRAAGNDADAAKGLEDFLAKGGALERDDGKEAIEHAMRSGWWDVSEKLLEAAAAAGVDVSTAVHQTSSAIHKKLQHLKDVVSKTAGAVAAGIPPAFEWAQSPDSVFLNVKFAHKLDTPATLGCALADKDVSLGDRALALRAECKAQKKVFALSLALLRDIVPGECSWSMLSVGRVQLTLRKAENGTWPRLLKSSKKLAHMHVWWAMREKYEAENDAWEKAAAAGNTTAAAPAADAAAGDVSASASPAAAAAKPAAATAAASKPAAPASNDDDEEVLAAEDEVKAKPAAAAAAEAATPSPSTKAKAGGAGGKPTAESAAARRRRMAREKAEAAKASAPKAPTLGDSGPGASFTTDQLYTQLAGSIEMRQRSEVSEVDDQERDGLKRIDEHLRKERAKLERSIPDPEALSVEKAKLEEVGRSRKGELRASMAERRADIHKKFAAEFEDLRSKLGIDGGKGPAAGSDEEL